MVSVYLSLSLSLSLSRYLTITLAARIFDHFLQSVVDTPALLCFVVLSVTVWRARTLYKRLHLIADPSLPPATAQKKVTGSERRQICYEELGCFMLDLPAGVCLLLLYVTRWHWSPAREDIRKAEGLAVHSAIFYHFIILLLDLPFIFCFLVVVVTVWRFKELYDGYLKKGVKITPQKRRELCLDLFLCVLLDIPALLCWTLVRTTYWHSNAMMKDLEGLHRLRAHGVVFFYALLLLLDSPFLLCIVIITLTGWRFPTLWRLLHQKKKQQFQESTRQEKGEESSEEEEDEEAEEDEEEDDDVELSLPAKRRICLVVLGCLLLDLPVLLLYLIVRATVWLSALMQKDLKVRILTDSSPPPRLCYFHYTLLIFYLFLGKRITGCSSGCVVVFLPASFGSALLARNHIGIAYSLANSSSVGRS